MHGAQGTPAIASFKSWQYGTHRAVPPAETVAHLRPHLATLGITRLADVTGLDRIGLPVFQAIRPLSRSVSVSQGKGLLADAARASALMEAAETWHAERIALPLRLMREVELDGHVIDTGRLPKAAGCTYDPNRPILWIEGAALADGTRQWLPFETVHADHTLPPITGAGSFLCSTNGLAAGNTLEEAICHALCEVIERDAVALWFRRSPVQRRATVLDLTRIADPACREAIERCAAAGIELVAWDATSDLGLPVCLCLLSDSREPDGHGGLGAGCHLAPEIALLRAVTEAVQVRMTYISGARDDIAANEYGTAIRHARLRAGRCLTAHSRAHVRLDDRPSLAGPSFAADLATLRERLAVMGLAAVVVDLTRAELGINVVRVLVPGLEGPDEHPSYSPGPRALAIAP